MDATCHSKASRINSFNYHHCHFLQTCWNHVFEWSKGPPREGFLHVVCVVLTFCPYPSWMGTYFVFHERKRQSQEDPAEWVYSGRQCGWSSPPVEPTACAGLEEEVTALVGVVTDGDSGTFSSRGGKSASIAPIVGKGLRPSIMFWRISQSHTSVR